MAFASIFVPNFMLQAVVRGEPGLRDCALALIEGTAPLCKVVAVSEKATHMGVEIGMAETNAAQFAGMQMRWRSLAQEKTTHAALLDIGWSVSPRIENTSQNTIVLDVSGLGSLFGSEKDTCEQLSHRASECGLRTNIAAAANIDTALIVARGFPGITVIPPGEESQHLSGLPVSVLFPSEEMAETLRRWGIHTCEDFARLPILDLSERLGQEGVRLHALARGAISRSLVIANAGDSFEEEMELDDAVEELDPLSFLLGRLLDQLCARLTARSRAAAAIRVRFELQPAFEKALDRRKEMFRTENPPGTYEKELQLPLPTRDSKLLLKLLRLRLQMNPPNAAIQKILIAADSARPRATQGGLFRPSFPDPDKLELTIARIAHVIGEANVGSPALLDTHRPGEFQMQRFLVPTEATKTKRKPAPHAAHSEKQPQKQYEQPMAAASFRAFRPPVPVRLKLHTGNPFRVIFKGLRGEVLAASGPWRTSGDWWRDDAWQQEEWDLEIHFHPSASHSEQCQPDCGLYRFYYDSLLEGWFVRGIYD